MTDVGYITRALLPGSLGNLDLFTVPVGQVFPTYDFANGGLDPGQATQRRQVAETMMHPGAGLLSAWPGMATPRFMFTVVAPDGPTLDEKIGDLVAAVYNQDVWELHVSFEGTRPWAWKCWKADEPQIGMTSSFWAEGADADYLWCPVAVTTLRDPGLVAGPYQDA